MKEINKNDSNWKKVKKETNWEKGIMISFDIHEKKERKKESKKERIKERKKSCKDSGK